MGKTQKKKDEDLSIHYALFPQPIFAAVASSTSNLPTINKRRNPVETACLQVGKLAFLNFGYDITQSETNGDGFFEHPAEERALGHRASTLSRGEYDVPGTYGHDYQDVPQEPVIEEDEEEVIVTKQENELLASQDPQPAADSHHYSPIQKSEAGTEATMSASFPKMTTGAKSEENKKLKTENSDFQHTIQDLVHRMKELQLQRDERDLIINERENSMRALTTSIRNLERERTEYLETIKELREKVDSFQRGSALLHSSSITDDLNNEELNEVREINVKLTAELSDYQKKYREVFDEDSKGLPFDIECPPWIKNFKFLSPLVMAYEDRLEEKELTIRDYERELLQLKERIESVLKENQRLHVENSHTVKQMDWEQLQEQAKLVLEENQILIEQVEVLQNKLRDQHHANVNEVGRLTRKVVASEADKSAFEADYKELNEKYEVLKRRFEPGLDETVLVKDHNEAVQKLKEEYEVLKEQSKIDIENLLNKLQKSDLESKILLEEKGQLDSRIALAEQEIKSVLKAQRKWQKKAILLEKKVHYMDEREATLSKQLELAVQAAEKATEDRNFFASEFTNKIEEKNQTILDLQEQKLNQTQLETDFSKYKLDLKSKLKKVTSAQSAQIEELKLREADHLNRIQSLQDSLTAERSRNDDLSRSKILFENSFDTLLKTAREDLNIEVVASPE